MSSIHVDLLTILTATEIESPSRFSVLGATRELQGIGPSGAPITCEPRMLIKALAAELYERLYIRPAAGLFTSHADPFSQRDHISALSAANTGTGNWEPGWTVRWIDDDGRFFVAKDDVTFWSSESALARTDRTIGPGGSCWVFVPAERRASVPAFYFAIGDAFRGDEGVERLGRYYWNLLAETSVSFMAVATSLLNESRIPFQLKVISDPGLPPGRRGGPLLQPTRRRAHRSAHRSRPFSGRPGTSPGGPPLHKAARRRTGVR